MVTTYLEFFNHRLSGAAFKVAFQVARRWQSSQTPDGSVRLTVTEFQGATGLSRNTVFSAIAEARLREAIEQTRDGASFLYRPNFAPVQNLDGAKIAPVQISDHTGLFAEWKAANKIAAAAAAYGAPEHEIAERAVAAYGVDDCRRAILGWATRGRREFADVLGAGDAVEQGIILFEFTDSLTKE